MFDHKLISQLWALALMTFPLSAQTYTNDPWVYTLNASNEATIVGFTSSSGEVLIPSQIDGFSVTQVGSGTNAIWPLLPFTNIFNNPLGNIIETAVVLPDTVKVIAARAFSFSHAENNGSPSSVFLPSGRAPRHFIKALHIGTSVTSIGQLAFESCSGLASLTLPDSVSHVGANAFGGTGLTNVFIGAGITNVNDLTTFGAAPLPPTDFPPTLISTNISTNGLTFAPGGAPGLSAPPLVNVDVSPSNPAFLSIDGVVFDKSATQIVLFPAARHRTFTIPDSVTYLAQDAFTGTGLTNIIIGAGITNIEHLFSLRGKAPLPLWSSEKPPPALKNINVSEANDAFSSIEGVLFDNAGNTLLIYPNARQGAYVVPTNVTNIADRAFEFCTGLTSVSIPDSVISIGQNAFTGTGLTEIFIGAGITNIDSFSSLCSDWLYPLFPLTGTAPPALTDIHVSEENPMFASAGGVLFDKLGNELLIYPRSRQGHYAIPNTVTSVREKAFLWTAVSSIVIPDGVTNIGEYTFASCALLTNVVIPDSVTSIGDNAFAWCWNLTSIRLPRPFWNDYARLGLSSNVVIANASLADFTTAVSQSFAEGANSMTNQIEEARTAGKAEVTSNPAAFNLFTKEQFDNNRAAGQQDVLQSPMTYGLYDSNSIMDLRMGGLMVQKNGSNAVVSFQPQTTTDLTQPFTNNGAPITNEIPMPGNKGFLRIQAGPQPAAPPALPGGFGGGGGGGGG